MTSFAQKYGPWALVTGAAMGLGAEFARQLARRGLNLVLVDVQAEKLEATARALSTEFSVDLRPLILDLSTPDFLPALSAVTQALEIGLVVNNAGVSSIGHFLDVPLDHHLRILQVNSRAALVLAHFYGAPMRTRRRGGLVFVSSMSALVGTSYVGEYSAAKAHNLVLGEALWQELRPFGVDVLTTVVGATDTPGWRAENPQPEAKTWPPVMLPADTVRETLEALGRAPSIVPGAQNRLGTWLTTWLLPRRVAIALMGNEMRKRYASVDPPLRQPPA